MKRILGLDPGLSRVGYAILDLDTNGKKTLKDLGIFTTSAGKPLQERLLELYEDLSSLIQSWNPRYCSLEKLFFTKNITNGIQVAEARGVLELALVQAGIFCKEFTPSEMKAALTGDGRADKLAIQKMVMLELQLKTRPTPDDAADALSLALSLAAQLDYAA